MTTYSLDTLNGMLSMSHSSSASVIASATATKNLPKGMSTNDEDMSTIGKGVDTYAMSENLSTVAEDTPTTSEGIPTPEGTPGPTTSTKANKVVNAVPLPPVLKIGASKGNLHLQKSFIKNNGMFFDSHTSSTIAVGQAQWHPPLVDPTIPQTPEQEQAIVRDLVDSLCDLVTANDTDKSPYRKRFFPDNDTSYEAWTIEACAWETLQLIKTLHTSGTMPPIFDAQILADIGQTEHWTFAQRIDVICRTLRNSKNVAVALMKREKIWTIIGAPLKLYQSNIVNTRSNKDRNVDVKTGRAARLVEKRGAEDGIKEDGAAKKKAKSGAVAAKGPDDTLIENAALLINFRGA